MMFPGLGNKTECGMQQRCCEHIGCAAVVEDAVGSALYISCQCCGRSLCLTGAGVGAEV
jgi:hypothetical protein